MLFALGAASATLDAIKSLTLSSSSSAQSTGFSQASADLFGLSDGASAAGSSAAASGSTGFSQISPTTLSALLAAQSQSSTPASANPGNALQNLFSQIDADGDGTSGTSGTSGSSTDPLLQALQGAATTSVTNSDGSTTTSQTLADGSKVTTTTPAPRTSSNTVTSSYNLIEQMMQRGANAISSSTPALSVNV